MQEHEILTLFHARDEAAIRAVDEQLGGLCRSIARQILGTEEDAEECWNDVLLRLWNAIPPAKPSHLTAYVCTVTRNAALDRYDRSNAAKRGSSQIPALLTMSKRRCRRGKPQTKSIRCSESFRRKRAAFLYCGICTCCRSEKSPRAAAAVSARSRFPCCAPAEH